MDSFGREGSFSSSSERRARRDERHACGRAPSSDSGFEFRVSVSGEEYNDEQEAVVCVRRSDWSRLTERDELVGKLSFGSRFPQYLEGVSEKIM